MFTIIIAAKDSEKWIEKTVASLQSQSDNDWECIISVNGSMDSTEQIANSINDSRFKTIKSEIPNKSLAINRALAVSSRDWICILDADDLWHVNKLEKQRKFLESHNDIDIVGTQMVYIDENDNEIFGSPNLPCSHEEILGWLVSNNNSIANSSVCYRRSIHDKVGYYDPEMFGVEDYDMWKRCARNDVKFQNLYEKLFYHRIHRGSSFNSKTRQSHLKEFVDLIDRTHRSIRSAT